MVGAGVSVFVFFLSKRFLDRHTKSSFDDLSRKTLGEMIPSILDLAKRELSGVREEISKDAVKDKGIIKETLEKLEANIKEKQEELRRLEEERNRQFGTLSESLRAHKEIAEKLGEATMQLGKLLSHNKLRGDWGERVLEDILRYGGLIEGVHYVKQAINTEGTVPDFTILLPNSRKVNIDAKFPFANLQLYQESRTEDEKREYLKRFSQDVKDKIREVTTRAYISEEDGTLDYVILFVPSEVVYGFIHDSLKDVLDAGFQKKVLITAPSTFYATVRIIMESYRYFAYEKNIREILQIVQGFIDNFKRFQDEFSSFDEAIKNLRDTYDKIAETRYKKMQVQIRKIEKIGYLEGGEKALE